MTKIIKMYLPTVEYLKSHQSYSIGTKSYLCFASKKNYPRK